MAQIDRPRKLDPLTGVYMDDPEYLKDRNSLFRRGLPTTFNSLTGNYGDLAKQTIRQRRGDRAKVSPTENYGGKGDYDVLTPKYDPLERSDVIQQREGIPNTVDARNKHWSDPERMEGLDATLPSGGWLGKSPLGERSQPGHGVNTARQASDITRKQYEEATGKDFWGRLGDFGAMMMAFGGNQQAGPIQNLLQQQAQERQKSRAISLLDDPTRSRYLSPTQKMALLQAAGFNPADVKTTNQYEQMQDAGGERGEVYTGARDASGNKQRTTDPVAMISNKAEEDVPGALALADDLYMAGRITWQQYQAVYDKYAGSYQTTELELSPLAKALYPEKAIIPATRERYAGDVKREKADVDIEGGRAATREKLRQGDKEAALAAKEIAQAIIGSGITEQEIKKLVKAGVPDLKARFIGQDITDQVAQLALIQLRGALEKEVLERDKTRTATGKDLMATFTDLRRMINDANKTNLATWEANNTVRIDEAKLQLQAWKDQIDAAAKQRELGQRDLALVLDFTSGVLRSFNNIVGHTKGPTDTASGAALDNAYNKAVQMQAEIMGQDAIKGLRGLGVVQPSQPGQATGGTPTTRPTVPGAPNFGGAGTPPPRPLSVPNINPYTPTGRLKTVPEVNAEYEAWMRGQGTGGPEQKQVIIRLKSGRTANVTGKSQDEINAIKRQDDAEVSQARERNVQQRYAVDFLGAVSQGVKRGMANLRLQLPEGFDADAILRQKAQDWRGVAEGIALNPKDRNRLPPQRVDDIVAAYLPAWIMETVSKIEKNGGEPPPYPTLVLEFINEVPRLLFSYSPGMEKKFPKTLPAQLPASERVSTPYQLGKSVKKGLKRLNQPLMPADEFKERFGIDRLVKKFIRGFQGGGSGR